MRLISDMYTLWLASIQHVEPLPEPPGPPPGKDDSLEDERRWMAARAKYMHLVKLRKSAMWKRRRCRIMLAKRLLAVVAIVTGLCLYYWGVGR